MLSEWTSLEANKSIQHHINNYIVNLFRIQPKWHLKQLWYSPPTSNKCNLPTLFVGMLSDSKSVHRKFWPWNGTIDGASVGSALIQQNPIYSTSQFVIQKEYFHLDPFVQKKPIINKPFILGIVSFDHHKSIPKTKLQIISVSSIFTYFQHISTPKLPMFCPWTDRFSMFHTSKKLEKVTGHFRSRASTAGRPGKRSTSWSKAWSRPMSSSSSMSTSWGWLKTRVWCEKKQDHDQQINIST